MTKEEIAIQEEIKKLFTKLPKSSAKSLSKDLMKKYDYEDFRWGTLEANDEIKEIAKKIFELCPQCNCIPIAYCNVCENEWYTKFDDYTAVFNYSQDYFPIAEEEYGYIFPYFDDDMKKKEWNEVSSLLFKLHDVIKNMGGEDETSLGDYCEDSHPTFIAFFKDTNNIDETEELR